VCHDNGRYPLWITSSMISPRTRFLPRIVNRNRSSLCW